MSDTSTSDLSEEELIEAGELEEMAQLPKLPEFNPKEASFDVYLDLVKANFTAHSITSDDKKKNILLISLGLKAFTTLANLAAPKNPSDLSYEEIVKALGDHYISKPTYHRSLVLFQQRKKVDSESLNDLYSNLKRLGKDCNFKTTFDDRLRDQLFMAVDQQPYPISSFW